MKVFWWVIAWGLVVALTQYSLFRENGEPRQFPSVQAQK
ncbi:hypothetical protein PF66_06235 [Pseudomonas asplenii]|uniref:Uncharacterized protein n=1 Tax=Pseudomonas asplenii TaxID=53407 RepID=A0A0M9GC06_9PSED|nr:hypothetical protein PF66_06235 [Pseudomonas fuscovaginae]